MKKIFLFGFLLGAFFSSVRKTSAHSVGMPPFFQVNGQYSNFYTIPSTSLDDLQIPQDQTPENYLVNTPVTFVMDIKKLPFPPELMKKTEFLWDFGDGEKGKGLENVHAYKKIGSYIVTISTKDGIFESVILQIVPDKNYTVPVAVIKINGVIKSENTTTPLEIKPGDTLTFDASDSQSASKIVEYQWDFGDIQTEKKTVVTHTYTDKFHLLFPLLRVKDTNGFIGDKFTTIENDTHNKSIAETQLVRKDDTPSQNSQTTPVFPITKVIAVISIAAVPCITLLLRRKKGKF